MVVSLTLSFSLSRYRKVIRAYQDSWDHRCRLLFCCMSSSEHNRNSFADIARLLSDFFRELDVVPSDVVAGLVLLRKFQKLERQTVVRQVIELETHFTWGWHWFNFNCHFDTDETKSNQSDFRAWFSVHMTTAMMLMATTTTMIEEKWYIRISKRCTDNGTNTIPSSQRSKRL